MQWNILSPTTTTTSRRLTCRLRIRILRRTLRSNDEIDKLRLSATSALSGAERCHCGFQCFLYLWNLGSPEDYMEMIISLPPGNGKGPGRGDPAVD